MYILYIHGHVHVYTWTCTCIYSIYMYMDMYMYIHVHVLPPKLIDSGCNNMKITTCLCNEISNHIKGENNL